jgi:hypothetical protein
VTIHLVNILDPEFEKVIGERISSRRREDYPIKIRETMRKEFRIRKQTNRGVSMDVRKTKVKKRYVESNGEKLNSTILWSDWN